MIFPNAATSGRKGFTLPEMLLTVGLLAFLVGLSVLAGSDGYRRALATNDVERIAGVLRRARSLAQANACQLPPCNEPRTEGVRVTSAELLMFEGTEFDASAVFESVKLSGTLVISTTDVSFLPRSGDSLHSERLRITDPYGKERFITVNETGVISLEPS